MKWSWAVALTLVLFIASCGDGDNARRYAFEKVVANNRIGSGSDYWLVKYNLFAQHERVGLIFGFVDDFGFCAEIAEMYMRRYPADRYSCEKAN